MRTYVLAGLVMFLCVAIKRVLDKKSKDYRPSFGVSEISAKEFKQQQKNYTAQEIYKLQQTNEFQLMQSVKENAAEEWNW